VQQPQDLKFHSLVLETTDRCNAKCAMCYQAAGPGGSDLRGDGYLPLDIALRVVEEAVDLPELVGSRIHLSGGESFLNLDDLCQIFAKAAELGFVDIGATTNAFWAITPSRAMKLCERLHEVGVTYLEVSIDYWHSPYVKFDRVHHLLAAMRRTGLRPILRLLSTRSHRMDEILAEFSAAELLHVQLANSRVQLVGRAATEIPADEVHYGRGVEGCCEQLLNLTIGPSGDVFPCCAGADMTKAMSSGNVCRESLADAVFKMKTDFMIRSVIHGGAGQLIEVAQSLGFGDKVDKKYQSICHLCWDVFHDDELADAIRKYYNDWHLVSLLENLNNSRKNPASG
jgi:uncharacterized Fe-S cluster-containing radical SAM superfamily protein